MLVLSRAGLALLPARPLRRPRPLGLRPARQHARLLRVQAGIRQGRQRVHARAQAQRSDTRMEERETLCVVLGAETTVLGAQKQ